MLLQLVVAAACLVAGVFQLFAAMPHIGEHAILRVARRITGVALLSAALYVAYTVLRFGEANPVYCWILGVFSLGQLLFSMHTFMDPHKTDALIQSAPRAINETSHA